jgi:hypothetical protein
MSPKLIAFSEDLIIIPFEHVLMVDGQMHETRLTGPQALIYIHYTGDNKPKTTLHGPQAERFVKQYNAYLSLIESQSILIKEQGDPDGSPSEQ